MPNSFNTIGRGQLQSAASLGQLGQMGQFDPMRQPTPQQHVEEQDVVRQRIDSLFKDLFDKTISEDHFVQLVKNMKRDQTRHRTLFPIFKSQF